MQRIYLPNTPFWEKLTLDDKDIHHQLTRVMRGRVGNEVIFFDGEHLEDLVFEITTISKTEIHFVLRERIQKNTWPNFTLSLYQALPNKFEKIEYIIGKCTEVGYSKIIFFESERSQKLVISENKKERFTKIAIEAVEQCWGNIIPEIEFWEWVSEFPENTYVCHTKTDNSCALKSIDFHQDIHILVGPEGGFSDTEISEFENAGVNKIFFWNRILRCETVWVVVWFFLTQK